MKVLISENKFKTFLKDRFGVDLTGKVSLITSSYDLPFEFDRILNPEMVRRYLNKYGPIYLIDLGKEMYLYQNRFNGDEMIADTKDRTISPYQLMDILGIGPIGVSIQDILDLYAEE
jgi:hypothetical protein